MRTGGILLLATAFMGQGCVGSIEVVGAGESAGVGGTSACKPTGRKTLPAVRRLSRSEYFNVLADLFPKFALPEIDVPADSGVEGFENVAELLTPNALLIERYEATAFSVSAKVAGTVAAAQALAGCVPGSATEEQQCGRRFIETLGRRAFRRPLTSGELSEFEEFFAEIRSQIDFGAAIQLTVARLLQTPEVLYRVELDSRPDGLAIASRLSFFIWQSSPDDKLLDAARAGGLSSRDGIAMEARRMLADPRSRRAVVAFHGQWLDFDRINAVPGKDAGLFPGWTPTLRKAMREESDKFIEEVMAKRNGNLASLFTSPETMVNSELAKLYGDGVPVPPPGTWAAATLPKAERAGLLTRASFQAAHAEAENGNPPVRGNAILTKVLCTTLGEPPMNADLSNPAKGPDARTKTNRQLYTERTAPAGCMSCHQFIDPLGFAFESYDATGAFRKTENNALPVDTRVDLTAAGLGGPLDGPVELSKRLAESDRTAACMASRFFLFAAGRVESPEDRCAVGELTKQVRAGTGILDLVMNTALSPEFLGQ